MWAADNITRGNMLFYPLYYDIISLISLKITQAFYFSLGFPENQGVFWGFKTEISIRITEGSDNGDSDNRSSTVLGCIIKNDALCIASTYFAVILCS